MMKIAVSFQKRLFEIASTTIPTPWSLSAASESGESFPAVVPDVRSLPMRTISNCGIDPSFSKSARSPMNTFARSTSL